MKELRIKGNTITVYDSIDDMPIVNFQKYNKYLLIDSGIGSDVDDVDAHIVKIAKFVKAGDKKKAMLELQNMRQNLYMINSQISPKYLAFASLIHSINGEVVTDLSDDNLRKILEKINAVKHSAVIKLLMALKKKFADELETYFPESFESVKEKEAYDRLKSRTLLVLDSIINDNDNSEKIEKIDQGIFDEYTPKIFTGSESVEVKYDKQFESMCLLIAQEIHVDAKKMTTLQFYNAIEVIKKQTEAKLKSTANYTKNGRR